VKGPAFYTSLMLFVVSARYGTVAVVVFDTFWPGDRKEISVQE